MRSRALALTLTAVATAAAALVPASSVQASTGGTIDSGNTYSNVALILSYSSTDGNGDGVLDRFRCTATLVSPTVLLTAAHCTDDVKGKVLVDFKWDIEPSATPAKSPFPDAKDNKTTGYTTAELLGTRFLSGTANTHPAYSDFTDVDNWNDVGVVVLDRPATGVKTSPIAGLGTLDAIKSSNLSKTLFRAVGYGTEVRKPTSGPQKPTAETYPLVRRYVDMPGQKLTPQILQTNGNDKDPRGTGGTCFGDSGGPVFLDGKIVAVTSYGYTSNCRYLGGYQRVDIAAARDWLKNFGL